MRSISRSITCTASGRPAPRYGAFGTLLVAATLRVDREVVDSVRPREMRGRVVDDRDAERIPCAAVDHEGVTQRENAPLVVEADLGVVVLVARMAGAQHMLAARLDPLYGPADPLREKRHQHVFGIHVTLHAETAADVGRDDAYARLRNRQGRGDLALDPVTTWVEDQIV